MTTQRGQIEIPQGGSAAKSSDEIGPVLGSPPSPHPEGVTPPGGISLRIDPVCQALPCDARAIDFTVESSVLVEGRRVFVYVEALGLDGRLARLRIDQGGADGRALGHEPLVMRVAASELPIQSIASLSALHLSAVVESPTGETTAVAGGPLYYEFTDATYTVATFHDDASAMARGAEIDATQAPRGRVLIDGAGLVGVETLGVSSAQDDASGEPAFSLGGGTVMLAGGGTGDGPAPPPPPPPAWPTTACFSLKALFNDAGQGEDTDNKLPVSPGVPAIQSVPAAHMRAYVRPAGSWGTVWFGHLNEQGCTPPLTLKGQYVFGGISKFHKPLDSSTHAKFEVRLHGGTANEVDDDPVVWERAFSVTGVVPLTIKIEPVGWDRTMNVTAVVARMMEGDSNWVTMQTDANGNVTPSIAFVDRGCSAAGIPPTDSCAMPSLDKVYIGPGAGLLGAQAMYKFLIAHEFGHLVQGQRVADLGNLDYAEGNEPAGGNALCRCDHVSGVNGQHCLQSRESHTAALMEGWAHFYAAQLYNNREGSDCRFVYYKSVNALWTVIPPPVKVDCAYTYPWHGMYCSSGSQTAVELDWLRLLWSLHANKGEYALDMSAPAPAPSLYRLISMIGFSTVFQLTWSDIKSGAQWALGGSDPNNPSARYVDFLVRAAQHSVDNESQP